MKLKHKKMDMIKLDVSFNDPFEGSGNEWFGVDIFINEKNLLDIVLEWESPLREMGYGPKSHAGIDPTELMRELETKETPAVLGCSCGSTYCGPFLVRVLETEKTVVWDESHLNWSPTCYDSLLKPLNFEFDKEQYRSEVAKIIDIAIEFNTISYKKKWKKRWLRRIKSWQLRQSSSAVLTNIR